MTDESLNQAVERILGRPVLSASPLSGGCIGEVYRVRLEHGDDLVAKWDARERSGLGSETSGLVIEGRMLRDLAQRTSLPVPEVLASEPGFLLLEKMPGATGCPSKAQDHAAELVAALHDTTGRGFGFDYDTLIGGLHLPNPAADRFVPFFIEHRILHFAEDAHRVGQLPRHLLERLRAFAPRLESLLPEPDRPRLLHGDLWSGNLLHQGSQITAFLDPALYFGHPEVDLAFGTMFSTLGETFFRRYAELRGEPDEGFFRERRDLWNLFPLLVHVRLFGGSYVGDVERVIGRFD
ncbi:MAG: fructosamine kinase family protein [Planctomycetota bacterium]